MNWKLLLDYLKFFAGMGLIIYAHLLKPKYSEIMILIGGLIIATSRVNVKFNHRFF